MWTPSREKGSPYFSDFFSSIDVTLMLSPSSSPVTSTS